MAEEGSRPAAEDDSEEEEEGEEAAVAPVKEKKAEQKAAMADTPPEKQKAAMADTPPEKQKTAIPPEKQKAARADTPPEKQKASTANKEEKSPVPATPSPPSSAGKSGAAACSSSGTGGMNLFANDGSFLELFKKKMETSPSGSKEAGKPEPDKRKPASFVGKRRGGAKLALKTGMVAKKPKAEDEAEVMSHKGGAWAQYMAEVKKYKAHQCSDDDKTRPLVK